MRTIERIAVIFFIAGLTWWLEARYRVIQGTNAELHIRIERLMAQNARLHRENRALNEENKLENDTIAEAPISHSAVNVSEFVGDARNIEEQYVEPIDEERERAIQTAEMQTAAISRLLTLNDAEKDSLFEMYRAAQLSDEPYASLESILGEQRANFIREEKRKAFSRSEIEEVERDAFYFSKKLGLNEDQELEVLDALTDIQSQLREERKSVSSLPMRDRMQFMLREAQLHRRILMQRMQSILTQAQLAQYIQYDSESSAADMEMWHSPPESEQGVD
ncbi:hypothetical protein EBR25_08695 [bacterium]|nr:hypothetical protein [bacterium]